MLYVLKLPGYPVLYPNNLVDEIVPSSTASNCYFGKHVLNFAEFDDPSSANEPATPAVTGKRQLVTASNQGARICAILVPRSAALRSYCCSEPTPLIPILC